MRVISDNAIDRAALSASSTAAGFSVLNLRAPRKSDTWRVMATSARLTALWATPERLQATALPFCDLSPTATQRVRVTTEGPATNLLTYSEQFGDASWERAGFNLGSSTAAPDGSANASVFAATTADPYINKAVTLAAGTYTFSIFLRGLGSTVGKAPNVWFWNINNLGGFSATSDSRPLASGWTRYSATATLAAGTYRVRADLPDVAAINDIVHVWGAQLEAGLLTSYFPAGASPATRPLGYIDTWQSYAYDSGAVLACPAPAVRLRGFTAAQSATAYAFGGGADARHWMPAPLQAYGLAIDIVDPGNAAGFIDAAYWVAGSYWEAALNVDYGASAQLIDNSKSSETDAGDTITDLSTKNKELNLPMSKLAPADSNALWDILTSNGTGYPVFVSVFPSDTDLGLEKRMQTYGKLVDLPAAALPFFRVTSATLKIRSV